MTLVRASRREDITISGRVVTYEPLLPAPELARQGRRLRYEADWARTRGHKSDSEALYRRAIERLVDAFLVDRRGHSGCFTEAHGVGRFVASTFGCPLDTKDGERWGKDCGVLALHQRFGSSFGGATRGRCSICAAEDLECQHVPGRRYGEQRCIRIVYEADLHEVSLVQFPEDPRCYRTQVLRTRGELEAAYGGRLPSNVEPICTHCKECPAADRGPEPDDIDQRLWVLPEFLASPASR